MDGFIDKFAQRKNAQEMIRANAMAEAEEKERMALKISEYEMAIQEMRQSSLQNIENAEKVKALLAESLRKIEEVQKKDDSIKEVKDQLSELLRAQNELSEKQNTQMQELLESQKTILEELMGTQKTTLEELFHGAEDFNHKEAVKVYRNVQAVIEAELPKQTEEIKGAVREKNASKGLTVIGILTLLGVIANVAIEVLRILGCL